MSEFLTCDLQPSSLTYLKRLAQAAPIEFIQSPSVYLSAPEHELGLSKSDHELLEQRIHVALEVDTGMALYNPTTQRAEFCVLMRPDEKLVSAFPSLKGFKPYFVWAYDPNRSVSSRSFLVSLVNSMVADAIALIGMVVVRNNEDQMKSTFNSSTQTDLHNVYIDEA